MSDGPTKKQDAPSELMRGVRLLAFMLLAFLAGVFATFFDSFPYDPLLKPALQALEAMGAQVSVSTDTADLNFWGEPRTSETGVTIHDKEKAYAGYTLYTSGHTHGAFLIDMDGNVVHEWEKKFSEVWPEPEHVSGYKEDRMVYWRRVEMLPGGDLIAQYYGYHATPYGYGLVKVDKDSKLIWKSEVNVHHDFQVAGDGSIWSIDHSYRNTKENPVKGAPQLVETILDDNIVQISADGKLMRTVNVYDAMANSPFHHIANFTNPGFPEEVEWDPLHTNSIALIGDEFASHHDFAEPGMVMISMRRQDALAIVDVDKQQFVWANRGFWTRQHDPDPLPNGNVLVYDNRGHAGAGGTSRIIEFDPETNAVAWMYAGTEEQPFESQIRSNQQLLPNGNILTCEHKSGRIFEVTRDGEVVWEFHNPHRTTENGRELVAAVGSVHRYPAEFPLKAEAPEPAAPTETPDMGSASDDGPDAGAADGDADTVD